MLGGLEVTDEESALFHRYLDDALRLDPDFALAYAAKAREYAYSLGRPVRLSDELDPLMRGALARENAERALVLDRDCGVAYAALGVLNRFSRRDEEAEGSFEKALALTPQDPRVLRDLTFYYLFRGRFHDASQIAQRFISVDPGFGSLLLAESRWWGGDLNEGLHVIQKALALRPNVSFVHAMHGFMLLLNGDSAGAFKALRVAETLGIANSPMGLSLLAYGYRRLDRAEDALRLFEKMADFSQTRTVDHGSWAMSHLAAGNVNDALKSLNLAASDSTPGNDVNSGLIAFNFLQDPTLEQSEFVRAREKLGVTA